MEKLISIIVPVYKVEKHLCQCIDSIINQTYKNLEIILVDDGSPDCCPKICDEYSKKDKRIKVIHKENGGLSSARNAGLDIASGEYISFIDSDDYISEKFIEVLYDLCEKNECDISECDFIKFEDIVKLNEVGKSVVIYTNDEIQNKLYEIEGYKHIVVWNKLYKRYLYEKLRFPIGKINEDEYCTYKAFFYCKTQIAYTTQQLYYYRNNSESIMGKKFNAKRLDFLDAFEERKKFYLANNSFELYARTVEYYYNVLKYCYKLTKENVSNPQIYLKKIKKQMVENCKEYMKFDISFIKKMKVMFVSYLPEVYYYMINKSN